MEGPPGAQLLSQKCEHRVEATRRRKLARLLELDGHASAMQYALVTRGLGKHHTLHLQHDLPLELLELHVRHHPPQQRRRQKGRRTREAPRRKQHRTLLHRLLHGLGGGGGGPASAAAAAAAAAREAALLWRVEPCEERPCSGEERCELNKGATAREQ
jgi:hypothetical protein